MIENIYFFLETGVTILVGAIIGVALEKQFNRLYTSQKQRKAKQ